MARIVVWIAFAVAGAAAFAFGVFYFASSRIAYRRYPVLPATLHVASSPAAIARGRHLAEIDGCTGCHKADLTGKDFSDHYPGMTLWARNLSLAGKHMSDADFDRAVRQGLRTDGTSLMLMPSEAFAVMPDSELSDIAAYIRSVPAKGEDHPQTSFGLLARWHLLRGELDTVRMALAKEQRPIDLGPKYALGRYLAMTSCAECHGGALAGEQWPGPVSPPDLSLVASYGKPDFIHLMRTGNATGNRELPLMSTTARMRFSHFTDGEVNALYDYLAARGQKLAAQ